jgi:hypothetical protein
MSVYPWAMRWTNEETEFDFRQGKQAQRPEILCVPPNILFLLQKRPCSLLSSAEFRNDLAIASLLHMSSWRDAQLKVEKLSGRPLSIHFIY